MAGHSPRDKDRRALQRRLRALRRRIPLLRRWPIESSRGPAAAARIVVGVLLIVGGLFGFLPVLGFWMIPLGLALLAEDFPPLRRPLRRALVVMERRVRRWRRRRRASRRSRACA